MARNLSRRAAPGKQSRRNAAIGSLDMDRNRLGEETSPYLLQHKDNPVQWQAWGPDALAAAKAEDKPILLSIGYAACHWCHVMAHESFEKPAIAAQMNDRFINIKVDREERPDLDAIYQNALALMGEQGGWPLTMFLTPEGEPFWGGTYYPPEPRWGRPGFPQVLDAISTAYKQDRDNVMKNVAALRDALKRLEQPQAGEGVAPELFDRIAERLLREVDPLNGGIGHAPKFPQCGVFELLWRAWKRTRREPYREAVTRTLTTISQGGICDHLGGGFARYSTDARWLAPHFEKMLYDKTELAQSRALLLKARAPRVRPGLDDKILADWNGLMIAALAEAGLTFDRADWVALATRAFAFIREKMTGEDGRLRHSWREGRARHPASVDDYANLSRAALALYEATSDPVYLDQAKAWVAVLDRHYWDNAGGGYFFAADDTVDLIARAKTASDAAVPAGNGTMVGVLARLDLLTGDDAYRRRAEAILGAFSGELGRNFFSISTLINNAEFSQKPVQTVLAGEPGDAAFAALRRAVYEMSLPNRLVLAVKPGQELPADHPAHGKGLVAGKPAAYVCEGPVCSLPLTDPQALTATLAELR